MYCRRNFRLVWLHLCYACALGRLRAVVVGNPQVWETSHGEGGWPGEGREFQSF